MNRMILAFGGVAAVVIAIVAGGWYFGRSATGPGGEATPSPTPMALPAAGENVQPGRYRVDFDGNQYTVELPDIEFEPGFGWSSEVTTDRWSVSADGEGSVPNFAALSIYRDVSTLYSDACSWTGTDFVPGQTVAEFATALAALDDFTTSGPTDITVSGYQGKRVQLSQPANAYPDNCDSEEYRSFAEEGTSFGSAGSTDDIRVMDIEGTRYLFVTHYQVGTAETVREALDQMLDRLEIVPAVR
jgi:hypothetical protein